MTATCLKARTIRLYGASSGEYPLVVGHRATNFSVSLFVCVLREWMLCVLLGCLDAAEYDGGFVCLLL